MKAATTKITRDVSYELTKLEFITDLRKTIISIVNNLTSEDWDESKPLPEENFLVDDEWNYGQQLFKFFQPFVEFLTIQHDSGFLSGEYTRENFKAMHSRFLDMTRFITQVFEASSKVFEEQVINQDEYKGLLPKFDQEVVNRFLSVR